MSEPAAGQSPTQVGNAAAAAEMAAVQSAARWLVAAGAAVAAALLAGIQLSSLGRLLNDGLSTQLVAALASSAIGLLSVGGLLVLAARVLIHPGWTLNRMAQLQVADAPKWAKHPVREALSARRALLVSDEEFDPDGLYRHLRALLVAWTSLHERGECTVATDTPDSTAEPPWTYRLDRQGDLEMLRVRLEAGQATGDRVVNTANLLVVRQRYRRLVRLLPLLGVLLVAALVGFAAATDEGPAVNSPLRVQLVFAGDPAVLQHADIPTTCANRTVEATAIGGSLEEPVVVGVDPTCRLDRTRITSEAALAVPAAPPAR